MAEHRRRGLRHYSRHGPQPRDLVTAALHRRVPLGFDLERRQGPLDADGARGEMDAHDVRRHPAGQGLEGESRAGPQQAHALQGLAQQGLRRRGRRAGTRRNHCLTCCGHFRSVVITQLQSRQTKIEQLHISRFADHDV